MTLRRWDIFLCRRDIRYNPAKHGHAEHPHRRLKMVRIIAPYVLYQLPSAIIKFKQGFGRLIRSKTDTGIVVVLDSRIATKSYGKKFLAAIPKCKVEIVAAENM